MPARSRLLQKRWADLLEHLAELVIQADDHPEPAWHAPPEDEVGHKHGDEHEEALAGEAQDGQRGLSQGHQLLVGGTLHLQQLRAMLEEGAAEAMGGQF